MHAFLTWLDLVPSPGKDCGSIREGKVKLPSFMTEEWVAMNIALSPASRCALHVYAEDITAETGAPFSEAAQSVITERVFLDLMRYPLFLRSVAARSAAGDPISSPSIFDIVKPLAIRFSTAMDRNARSAMNPKSASSIIRSTLENGTEAERQVVKEMAAVSSMLVPFPDLRGIISRDRGLFGDVAYFVDEMGSWLGQVSRHLDAPIRPSWELFRDFMIFKPDREQSKPFMTPIEGVKDEALAMNIVDCIPKTAWIAKAIEASAGEVAKDIGMAEMPTLSSPEDMRDFLINGMQYPLFLVSLSTRMSLLEPEQSPTWHMTFQNLLFEFLEVANETGWLARENLSYTDIAMGAFSQANEAQKQVIVKWLMLSCLVHPDLEAVAFLEQFAVPHGLVQAELMKVANLRLAAGKWKYKGINFDRMAGLAAKGEHAGFGTSRRH